MVKTLSGAGLDGFYSIYQGPLFFQKDAYGSDALLSKVPFSRIPIGRRLGRPG